MKNYNYQPLLTVIGSLLALFIFLFLIKAFNIYYPVSITNSNKTNEFSVVGEAKVQVVPDTAYIDAGINANNVKTADEAQTKIANINNEIINAVKQLGIAKEDIKTSQYSVNPAYSYENNQNKVNGYNGDASVTIKVKDPKMASKVIEAVTRAGATNVNGTRFAVDDTSKYREEARNKAIENAKQQAKKLSNQLGIHPGRITNMVETEDGGRPPYQPVMGMAAKTMSADAESQPTIEAGSQTVNSSVTLYFETY